MNIPKITIEPRPNVGKALLAGGSVLLIVSALLAWSYDSTILGDLSISGNPAPLQELAIVMGVVGLIEAALVHRRLSSLSWWDTTYSAKALAVGALVYIVLIDYNIAFQSGGVINLDPGAWLALVATLAMVAGALLLAPVKVTNQLKVHGANWLEIVVIAATLAGLLFMVAFILHGDDGGSVLAALAAGGTFGTLLFRGGFFTWLSVAAARHRPVIMLGALVVALLFPLTQNGTDANMSIAVDIAIFLCAALGLNIVVGLAGLLDLGYIAFLGTGAYVGAMMSSAASATIGWHPPFLVVALLGALTSAVLGLIIGSPTLRLSGDYLAIVTLAFGEIFHTAVNNMDGTNGPDLTHGPNGIAGIPDLNLFGFNFGSSHKLGSFTISNYSNYYILLVFVAALIITIFSRLNNSRIGRGWIAIREDERAAEAMGVNIFGLKILAFAGGAFLAGLAGTVQAHATPSVVPDNYTFQESSFLLAAVVLGGMGTVVGVALGATVLKLLPEKLRFIEDYRLLIFGLALVLMMRFRPEGLIASRRRQLEFHDEDEDLATVVQKEHVDEQKANA
ncbi:branched-chain amino acid ABC transporter permease [Allobranchiibius sp. GilTou38]|uniref:branched-chain amino acid ABC transporter permease n=1 Tax=Allobranchiibius sp. GilTou38 TaxID=2815210 RepID=UPI001AA178EA|nr:branched-chain amino acid ABC transporter permease [Allobranchiibius sp. GilTou38]MBO1766302.1 branched-chain amino acid ABC transporter permease [Allobranchiibius sp. GilTou38]